MYQLLFQLERFWNIKRCKSPERFFPKPLGRKKTQSRNNRNAELIIIQAKKEQTMDFLGTKKKKKNSFVSGRACVNMQPYYY